MNLNELTIKQAHQGLVKKEFSAVDLTKACLAQIKNKEPEIQAFLTVTAKEALVRAKVVDEKISANEKIEILEGIPTAIKDNILIEGVKTTAAAKILKNYTAPYDATVIKKLKKEGAIFLGKTNLDEFAMGSSTENSAFYATKNPHDSERVPGGSSGGSAAAVASHETIYALGSDTGGSIRLPASFCGVVGLKPTYGRVSRSGLLAMASSLDQIGPLTKNVEDAAVVFEAIAGKDCLDSTSKKGKLLGRWQTQDLKGSRVGVPQEYFVEGMDPAVEKKVRSAIKKIEALGAQIKEISLPHTKYALAVYYIIMPAEVSANLARYDGLKYGYSDKKAGNLLDVYLNSRGSSFGKEVRRRIMLGTYVLSAGYYNAYYLQAQKLRTLIREDFSKAFRQVDCIVSPTAPTAAFRRGEKFTDPLTMYLTDVYTVSANVAGLPGISLPCGWIKPQNGSKELPVGLQILGRAFDEQTILQVAHVYEQAAT